MPADGITAALQRFPEIKQAGLPLERYRQLLAFCQAAAGLPRHMGTHPSGLVIANRPLAGLAPLQKTAKGTVMIALDKNQVEECGLLKLDLLSLRALGAMDDTLRLLPIASLPRHRLMIPPLIACCVVVTQSVFFSWRVRHSAFYRPGWKQTVLRIW